MDYTPGLAFALANTEPEARELVQAESDFPVCVGEYGTALP